MQRFIDSKGSRLAALSFVGLFCASFASSGSAEEAANVDRDLEISMNAPTIASNPLDPGSDGLGATNLWGSGGECTHIVDTTKPYTGVL